MSLKEDLRRNRLAYYMISGNHEDKRQNFTAQHRAAPMTKAEETGLLDDETFERRVLEMNRVPKAEPSDWQNARVDPPGLRYPRTVSYSLSGSSPVFHTWDKPASAAAEFTTSHKISSGAGKTAPTPKVSTGENTRNLNRADAGQDLLDELLQRLERSARQYPQDLSEGG